MSSGSFVHLINAESKKLTQDMNMSVDVQYL